MYIDIKRHAAWFVIFVGTTLLVRG